ncbi:MAG: TIGR02466 family protein [Oligoflexia bacterium]|nr:TIGR02466 family protein [Oligoflexia bacterium]
MNLFVTKIHKEKIYKGLAFKKLKKQVLLEIEDLYINDRYGKFWSKENYPNGYTSYSSVNKLHEISSTFDEIRKKIDAEVFKFIKKIDLNIKSNELKMDNFWANVMNKNSRHSSHIHPKAIISGTFYVQIPKDAESIKFEDPRMMFFMNTPLKKENAKLENRIHVSPNIMEGEVILFESWLRHEVPTSKSKEQRISLSFNYS